MRKPFIYQAAGWFDEEQRKQYEEVYGVLRMLETRGDIDLFAPKYDGIVLTKDDPNVKKKLNIVWWLDIEMIKRADLMIALTVNRDIGTCYETGYIQGYSDALGLDKRVMCYNSVPEHGLNVMLMKPSKGFIKTPSMLTEAVLSYIKSYKEKNLEEWHYNIFNGDPI